MDREADPADFPAAAPEADPAAQRMDPAAMIWEATLEEALMETSVVVRKADPERALIKVQAGIPEGEPVVEHLS